MQAILARLVDKISAAEIDPQPSDNIFMEEVFDAAIYAEILARLPAEEHYSFIEHPDAILPDGTKTRKLIDLTEETIAGFKAEDQNFWQQMHAVFTSQDLLHALMFKFRGKMRERFGEHWPEMVSVPIFYRDYPGYFISVHTDAPYKIATMQFYFPRDNSQIHLGTSFHQRQDDRFPILKTNPFKPNSAYAFARTDTSWHSVQQMATHELRRDSLALTIYQKGHEFKSSAKVYR